LILQGRAGIVKKILISLYGNDVAPRFDLATEVLIASVGEDGQVVDEKILVLPQASAEKLCHMVLTEDVQTVICGGIEEEYYQYLVWKRVEVLDSVIGPANVVMDHYRQGTLQSGDILLKRRQREGDENS
jgi:predicted Fe-Mo cluster-binding NifX family protein